MGLGLGFVTFSVTTTILLFNTGLVATSDLNKGQIIFSETPLVCVRKDIPSVWLPFSFFVHSCHPNLFSLHACLCMLVSHPLYSSMLFSHFISPFFLFSALISPVDSRFSQSCFALHFQFCFLLPIPHVPVYAAARFCI